MQNTPNPSVPYVAPYVAPFVAPAVPKIDGLAIAAMVLGICGLFLGWLYTIPCVLAVVFASISLNRIGKSQGWRTGKGFAVTGLVTGIVGLSLWGIVFLAALGSNGY
jgi:Domain of unknown function (DUF4190)